MEPTLQARLRAAGFEQLADAPEPPKYMPNASQPCYDNDKNHYPHYSEMRGDLAYDPYVNGLPKLERAERLSAARAALYNATKEFHEHLDQSPKIEMSKDTFDHLLTWASNVGFHARTTYGKTLMQNFMGVLERVIDGAPPRFMGTHPWGDWYERERLVAYWLKFKEFEMTMPNDVDGQEPTLLFGYSSLG